MLVDPTAWLDAFRSAAVRTQAELDRLLPAERARPTGKVGAGGDPTLEVDAFAEDAILEAIEPLARAGAFTIVSEERGVLRLGDAPGRIAIDPIDGSLNARRGLGSSSMSVAVADGPLVSDVALAFVWDFGAREGFHAIRGEGAFLDDGLLRAYDEQRVADGRLELLCIEASDASRTAEVATPLAERAFRWRVLGSIASAMCQVAASRVDAMVNVSECRIIDAAAAMLIVRESGGVVRFSQGEHLPLALDQRTRVVAARSIATADDLLGAVA